MSSRRYLVNGMTCDHCVRAVTQELTSLDAVGSVDVTLVPGGLSTVVVEAAASLTHADVARALDEAGAYALAG
jgi:copper chaperone CopZ